MNNQGFLQHICRISDWLPGWTSWLRPRHADALEIPADLEAEQSGVCFIDGRDELEYLWYRLREAEGGREYAGYRVVRHLDDHGPIGTYSASFIIWYASCIAIYEKQRSC